MMNLIREDLRAFQAYSSARCEASQGRIWLNANESPWENGLNRYPDPQPQALAIKMAEYYGVEPSELLITRGSDEAIDLLIRLFCRFGQDAILVKDPSYGMYEVSARLQGAAVIKATDWRQDWNLAVKIAFVCSPNNPTGEVIPLTEIEALCQEWAGQTMIVIDEAYIEFASQASLAALINRYDNLVVLRTLSKAFGLAGIRCGAVLAAAPLIACLKKIIAPYPIAKPTADLALQAFEPAALAETRTQIALIQSERARLSVALSQCQEVVKIWPSEANYILIKVTDAQKKMAQCQTAGVILRRFERNPLLNNCIRVSIGLPAENNQVIALFGGQ